MCVVGIGPLQEDNAVLEAGTYAFQSNHRNAIVILKGEKEVCHHYIKLAEVGVPLLESDVRFCGRGVAGKWGRVWRCGCTVKLALCLLQYATAKKAISKLFQGRSDINDYVNAVVVALLKQKSAAAGGEAALAQALLLK